MLFACMGVNNFGEYTLIWKSFIIVTRILLNFYYFVYIHELNYIFKIDIFKSLVIYLIIYIFIFFFRRVFSYCDFKLQFEHANFNIIWLFALYKLIIIWHYRAINKEI